MRIRLHSTIVGDEDFTEDENSDGSMEVELPEGAVIRRLETLQGGGWRILWWERV